MSKPKSATIELRDQNFNNKLIWACYTGRPGVKGWWYKMHSGIIDGGRSTLALDLKFNNEGLCKITMV